MKSLLSLSFISMFNKPRRDPRERLEIPTKDIEEHIQNVTGSVGIPETLDAWDVLFTVYFSKSLKRRLRVRILKNFVGEPYFGFYADGKQLFNG